MIVRRLQGLVEDRLWSVPAVALAAVLGAERFVQAPRWVRPRRR